MSLDSESNELFDHRECAQVQQWHNNNKNNIDTSLLDIGINNDDEFWKLISERGFVQEPIEDRYGKGQCPHDGFDSPMRVASPYEGLIKDGEELHFDCALFGMSPNDAKRMDPQCKMMLSCTWEALEMAGLDQASLHNSNTGVFCGVQVSSCAGWRPPFGATPADVPGKSLSMISNRISFHFNSMGPSVSVATACSSGITALDAAIKSLSLGECDLAASGAVNYLGHEVGSIGFNQLGIISKTGTSRSFDKDANGYMRAEGAFMYLLKRLPDAERDGDRIFAVIRGCGLNTAGAEKDADVLTQGRMIVAPVPPTTPPSRAARARARLPRRAQRRSRSRYLTGRAMPALATDPSAKRDALEMHSRLIEMDRDWSRPDPLERWARGSVRRLTHSAGRVGSARSARAVRSRAVRRVQTRRCSVREKRHRGRRVG
jgi:3-oxoacyl-(acyl-carrier-protein) synthase